MTQATTVPPLVNRAMKAVLRSPLHGLVSKTVLLITFTGCKSGKPYSTPVSYSWQGDAVYIFTHATWWKNLCGGAPVTLRIRGREIQGLAEPVDGDQPVIAARLAAHLRMVPGDAGFYQVTFDRQGNLRAEEVEKAVQTVVMVCVRPDFGRHPAGAYGEI
ncbi:MAG: nitroreductase family deazaflavin-dependent oxidoreductase [Chloroflexi bacterium]|nr:nitroreductase/quinone reductase family protein [Anaerolineaceae bacterium]NMB91201.1 nitroreductase family deazaflavin-dependent oxidoreductase [Chloroflexota bacterium]